MEPTTLDKLRERRAKLVADWGKLIDARETDRSAFEERRAAENTEDRPSDSDVDAFRVAEDAFKQTSDLREAEIRELDERIRQHEDIAQRLASAAAASTHDVRVTSEPATYRKDNANEVSYFRDLAASDPQVRGSMAGNTQDALERLQRHAKDSEEFLTKRAIERERRANEQIDTAERQFARSHGLNARGFDASPFERRVNPNRTVGQGGTFVPPVWLIDEFIPYLRAGRVAANLCRQLDLPEGTDSINIPKLATPTRTAIQGQDNAAVASQDFTDTSVQANVKTIAGQQDIAIQLVEQSPGQIIDRVVMEDLLADYNQRLDLQVIVGNGTNSAALNGGQVQGIYPANNWGANQVTWTTATPLGTGFNMVLGAMASKTARSRYNLQNFSFLLNPSRWFWFATALDGATGVSGRPLVNQESVAYNVSAVYDSVPVEEGLAGRSMFGPNVYIDDNVPITDNGTGSLTGVQDLAIGAKWDDLWLFEGDLRTRVLPEVLSGTLEIRFQLYNYVAFLSRYGPSITLAQGTGFAAPVSAIDSSVTFR